MPNPVFYHGRRTYSGIYVTVSGGTRRRPWPLRHVAKHSPTGFEWGYGGSGPADLALSILTDAIGKRRAEALYQQFKWERVAHFSYGEWTISRLEVFAWAQNAELDRAGLAPTQSPAQ